MQTQNTTAQVGWTRGKIAVARLIKCVLVVAVAATIWSMMAPWFGLSRFDAAPPSCLPGFASNGLVSEGGLTTETAAATPGCMSSWQAVKESASTPAPSILDGAPMGLPAVKATMGLPSPTLWLVVSALCGILALTVRNALWFLPTVMAMNTSQGALADHTAAMKMDLIRRSYGTEAMGQLRGDEVTEPMLGVTVHGYAFLVVLVCLGIGAMTVLAANAKQRAADQAAYQRGDIERPPSLLLGRIIESQIMRGALDRIGEAAAASAKEKTTT